MTVQFRGKLKDIQKEEKKSKIGHLKIFFGMSAGVGKTYSMLEEAQQKLQEGVNVVVGAINTHGRIETEELLKGLTIVPEKWVSYQDKALAELDLDSILKIKPQLVIIDELAHTNVLGTKHPKRWQDVIEILDAGIDVYTTLNVEHLESRKEIIEPLTGIQIKETVPDLILERAASIELVDIPPSELLQRLSEGKVYLNEDTKSVADKFFKEENLTALRELALRFTAEKVDHDLHGMLSKTGWRARERIMVAISSSPSSEQLIRAARVLAFELDAPWIAVYVDTGKILNDRDQVRLNRHFNLARDLGAEVITTHDLDIATALQQIAKQKDITRIVIGRPPKQKFSFWTLFQGTFIDRLENENKHIDIVILREEKLTSIYQRSIIGDSFTSPLREYGLTLAFGAVITLLGLLINPLVGYKSVGFIFLLGILILSLFVGRGPIFFAAFLSALCWDFLFIPPILTATILDPQDIAQVIVYFCVAAIMGIIASRLRQQEQFMHKREQEVEKLYEVERDIASSANLQYLKQNVNSRLENIFPGKFDILVKSPDNQLILDSQLRLLQDEKEKTAALWVFQNGKIGGWSTNTMSDVAGLYFPILFSKSSVGVLAYFPRKDRPLSIEEMNFIQTITEQLGIYLERYIFEERVSRYNYSAQIERLHHSIFHSLNRSFYGPLEGITKINHEIQQSNLDSHTRTLVNQMDRFISNIKVTVDNIIAMSELESGFIAFDKKNHSIKEFIDQCLNDVKSFLNDHSIKLELPEPSPFLPFDFDLLKLAVVNLILNALQHTPPSSEVLIKVQVFKKEFSLSVLDRGIGVPEEILPLIFDKFYHAPRSTKGLGLGLAIVRSVVGIHQGKIEVKNREGNGTEFSLILPL